MTTSQDIRIAQLETALKQIRDILSTESLLPAFPDWNTPLQQAIRRIAEEALLAGEDHPKGETEDDHGGE